MSGVNKVILVGYVGQDPELKETASGFPACSTSIGCTESRKNQDGTWEDHTEWVYVRMIGKTAENFCRFMHKGSQVYVEGRLETYSYNDRETGEKKWKTNVFAYKVVYLSSSEPKEKKEEERPPRSAAEANEEVQRRLGREDPQSQSAPQDDYDDPDLPF